MAAELGQQTVDFSALVRTAAEESYLSFKDLIERSKSPGDRSDSEKKIDLLKFIVKTRQRMLRLHVLAKWCQQVPLVHYCQRLASTLSSHDTCFTQTADSLFFMHEGLQQARAPLFDVPSAIEVLLTRGYRRLPKCIEDIGIPSTLPEDQQKQASKKLDTLLRSKLLEDSVPKEFCQVIVSDGTAVFYVNGEFKVFLTLGYRGHLSMWRILHLELLVGEKDGLVKLEETRRYALGDDLERRMASADNPLMILYTILHDLCVALVMDTVVRQVRVLRQGRWKDAIRFELVSDGSTQLTQDGELDSAVQKIPVLKIIYWLDFEKNAGGSESGSSPFIRIETGQDQQIKCIHSSFILDPLTDREAEFSLDQSCIDVEQLLLRAISCNRHTRLLEIQRELSKNVQIGQSLGDIILKHDGDEADASLRKKGNKLSVEGSFGNEVLRMRAHGASYITLGINIRNGRFLLQSSENILSKSALLDFEEALNLETMTATDVFLSLKRKSILHLFASSGRFLGLKVYEKCLNSLKMPKSLLLGSDFLLMGFPNCRSSYYLLMQLDKDFKPILNLLEVQPDVDGKSHSVGDGNHILRSKIIDIGKMQVVEDELNHNVLDWEKLHSSKIVEACNKVPENALLPRIGLESPLQLSISRSRFSSIVDEVFELENGVSRSSLSIQGTMIDGSCISEILSPVQTNSHRLSGPSVKQNDFENSSTAHSVGYLKNTRSSSWIVAPISSQRDIPLRDKTSVKRSLSDILELIPSFQSLEYNDGPRKRRKISESQVPSSLTCNTGRQKYGTPLADVKHSLAPSNIYVSVLLHVVRHCSLCIKHAQLTSQMASLEIPYVEEVGLQIPSSNLWFRLPFARDDSWQNLCLNLGKPGSMCWDVKVNDPHFRELWDLQKGSTATRWGSGVRTANTSDNDSHIHYEPEGVILCYKTVEADSIQKLVSDLRRLSNALLFARGMRDLIGVRADSKVDDVNPIPESKTQLYKGIGEAGDRLYEQMRKTFKIEAVGLMSLWFSYGAMPVMAHFVVEWEAGKEGCTMHVSPDHLWPHTKFLEDFVNGAEVASFLDCIRLTAGPLLALASAIPPARTPGPTASGVPTGPKPNIFMPSQGLIPNPSSSTIIQPPPSTPLGMVTTHSAAMLSAAGRGGSGIFPSSLLPIDVSIVLRGPYWIRIIYRKKFSVDMRCFAGDQVWLQPATPPKGGPSVGGSLPCPQFRPFIMEHVAQGLNALEPNFPAGPHMSSSSTNQISGNQIVTSARPNSRPNSIAGSQVASSGALNRASNTTVTSSGISGLPLRVAPATGVSLHVRGELNTAFIGLGDDGGYGGGWVPLAALKKVLRGILKYLGVLWLFAQLPDLLKEILGSILKENEGALLNLDQEQPALRFFVGGYVFAVSVHRVQLLLQVVSVKRFHHQQASQQQAQLNNQEELSPSEINEICDYFSRRVASEPYDASRVASFITLLTLPISVLREFLKLISWKKGLPHPHGGEIASAQRARVELCLENHSGSDSENSSTSKSNIHHDRVHYFVDFALTFVLDPAYIPHVNAAGGAAWLPYCVSVRLRYSFGESSSLVSFLGMDGSHGGRACWLRLEEWEKCKQRVAKMVDYVNGSAVGDAVSQGRLKVAAETLQKTLQMSLQQPRDSALSSSSGAT